MKIQNDLTMETKDIRQSLVRTYLQRYPSEAAEILNSTSESEIINYLKDQSLSTATEVFLKLNSNIASTVLAKMEDSFFLELFPMIDQYRGALLISRLNEEVAAKKLALLPDKVRKEIQELMTYPAESAGFLMDMRIITFHPADTVRKVLKKLRTHGDLRIVNTYVVDEDDKLLGRVSLQAIAITPPNEVLRNLMVEPVSIHVMSPQEDVVDLLKDGKLISLPVVDLDNKLLGIIRHDALVKAARQDATEDLQAMFGAGREERALSKVGFAVKKRLPWLQINLVTAFLAAGVVGIFEDTIAQITVLAVFLPVVAGQSGNTGSQALAVTMRGLALREIRPAQWLKIARKEAAVGLINGIAVSLTTAVVVYFWASSLGLAVVIGTSMVFSMVIAGFSGAVIPIFLKSIGQDPAQSSSIVLTTVTDIVGFMSFLGLATALGTILGIV